MIFGRTFFQLATIAPNSVTGTFLFDNALDTFSLNYKTMKSEDHKVLLIFLTECYCNSSLYQ